MTAKGLASEVARQVGESALQVHGGIAFTEEFDDNRWFLRALTLQGMYGDQAASFDEVGRTLLARPAAPGKIPRGAFPCPAERVSPRTRCSPPCGAAWARRHPAPRYFSEAVIAVCPAPPSFGKCKSRKSLC